MCTASLPLAREYSESNPTLSGLQVLLLALLLCGIYGNLPEAISQRAAGEDVAAAGNLAGKTLDDSGKEAAGTCFGGKHGHKFNKPYGYYLKPILEHVGASPEQKVRITTIVQSFRGRIQPLTEEYREKNHEFLNNVLHGEHPEVIMDEQTHLGRLYSDITLSYCQMSLEVRRILNPDQIVRYEEFKRQRGWASTARPQN